MGIQYLNRHLRTNCKKGIKCVHLSTLRGKKIAIDTSIYMYKYLEDNALIENMYLLISQLRLYDIIPIFVFDGKPPNEKMSVLCERKRERKNAEEVYTCLEKQLIKTTCVQEKRDILNKLDILGRKKIRIHRTDIEDVKILMDKYGVMYYDAEGEADQACVLLLKNNKVDACMSEDMDFLVYGCSYVLRYYSLAKHTVVQYDMDMILSELQMSEREFREICVVSGTDYNKDTTQKCNLIDTIQYYKEFKDPKNICPEDHLVMRFYDWLDQFTNYIEDKSTLYKTYKMFDIRQCMADKDITNINVKYYEIDQEILKHFLREHGFIFV